MKKLQPGDRVFSTGVWLVYAGNGQWHVVAESFDGEVFFEGDAVNGFPGNPYTGDEESPEDEKKKQKKKRREVALQLASMMSPGLKVHYISPDGKIEQGIVKSISDTAPIVFVVYRCAGEWDNYESYTGVATDPLDLRIGWIDDPEIKAAAAEKNLADVLDEQQHEMEQKKHDEERRWPEQDDETRYH